MENPNVVAEGKSVFTLGRKVKAKVAVVGKRVSVDTTPTIKCLSQINKFAMSDLAAKLIGCGAGDRVKLIVTDSPELNGRFLIVKCSGDDSKGAKLTASTGKEGSVAALNFNYVGVYSQMQSKDVNAEEKNGLQLVEEGVAVARANTFYLDHATTFTVVKVEDITEEEPLEIFGDDDETVVESFSEVFALIDGEVEKVDNTRVIMRKTKEDAPAGEAVETTESTETTAIAGGESDSVIGDEASEEGATFKDLTEE